VARMIAGSMASAAMFLGSTAWGTGPCATILAPDRLSPSWSRRVEELRAQVALLPASDCQPTTLVLEPVDGAMRIVATRPDGARTERRVTQPETLVSTAIGLVMTIPPELPPARPESPAQRPLPPPPAPVPPVPPPPAPVQSVQAAPPHAVAVPRTLSLWAGLSAGVRLAAPTDVTVLDVEARADLVMDRWLLLATIRSALVSCLGGQGVDCDVYNDVSLGVGVGRRIPAGGAELDVAFEPSVVVMRMEYDALSEDESFAATEITLRLDASARLAVPIGKDWALTLTMDAGLAPNLLVKPVQLEVPAGVAADARPSFFPAWTGGVRVGALGALL